MLNPYLEKKSPAFLFPSEFFKKVWRKKKMNKQRFMTTVDKPHVVKNYRCQIGNCGKLCIFSKFGCLILQISIKFSPFRYVRSHRHTKVECNPNNYGHSRHGLALKQPLLERCRLYQQHSRCWRRTWWCWKLYQCWPLQILRRWPFLLF